MIKIQKQDEKNENLRCRFTYTFKGWALGKTTSLNVGAGC